MVHRHVCLKFNEESRDPAAIDVVVRRTPGMLADVEQIQGVRFGLPADDKTRTEWDLLLVVELRAPEDIEAYRVHPAHVAYYQGFLKPRLAAIKAWNFVVA